MQRRIDEEDRCELESKERVQRRKRTMHRLTRNRHRLISQLENKSGIVKVREGFQDDKYSFSEKINELSTPKSQTRWEPLMYSETAGMLVRDQLDALKGIELRTETEWTGFRKRIQRPMSAIVRGN